MLKRACRHDRIDCRDERRSAGKPGGDDLKARVRRRSRAHDEVEIQVAAVIVKPMPTIIAAFVDDNGRLVNADRAKPVKGVANQGPPADRRHRFADAITVRPQASPVAGRDDSPAQDKRFWRADHVRMSRRSGNSVTEARTDRFSAPSRSVAWTSSGAIQMKPMPERRAPS